MVISLNVSQKMIERKRSLFQRFVADTAKTTQVNVIKKFVNSNNNSKQISFSLLISFTYNFCFFEILMLKETFWSSFFFLILFKSFFEWIFLYIFVFSPCRKFFCCCSKQDNLCLQNSQFSGYWLLTIADFLFKLFCFFFCKKTEDKVLFCFCFCVLFLVFLNKTKQNKIKVTQ